MIRPCAHGLAFSLIASVLCGDAHALTPGDEKALSNRPLAAAGPYAARLPLLGRDRDTVAHVQRALIELGFYSGPTDGRPSAPLEAAIRDFQSQLGLRPDGDPSPALLKLLKQQLQAEALNKRLEDTRRAAIDAAVSALRSNPATRGLLSGDDLAPADPTRDAEPCLNAPSVPCLLEAALAEARAIHKASLRDWALGEILIVQARAGLSEAALETTRHIKDPRLVISALSDIAETEARAGRGPAALAAAELIPGTREQVSALARIAGVQSRHGHLAAARTSAELLLSMTKRLSDPGVRVQYEAQSAVILARLGRETEANGLLRAAEARARQKLLGKALQAGLRQIADALTRVNRPDAALAILPDVARASERASLLLAASEAQAQAGDFPHALRTARQIKALRYRTLAFGRIAVAQARRGDLRGAEQTIDGGLADVDKVRLPFARSFAVSRLALALGKVNEFSKDISRGDKRATVQAARYHRASLTASRVRDPRLRAETLFALASSQRHVNMPASDIARTEAQAHAATQAVKSRFARMWVYADVAALRAHADEIGTGRTLFQKALSEARKIDNPWSRARALAKLAETLIDVSAADAAGRNDTAR